MGLSTNELEARILAGGKVTAEEMATAKAKEDAAARISELIQQREAAEALEANRQEVRRRYVKLESDFESLEKDKTLANLSGELNELVFSYLQKTMQHNNDLSALRTKIEDIQGFAADKHDHKAEAPAGGGARFDGRFVRHLSDWESDLRRTFEQSITDAKARAAQGGGK